jgi:hypothetical protein
VLGVAASAPTSCSPDAARPAIAAPPAEPPSVAARPAPADAQAGTHAAAAASRSGPPGAGASPVARASPSPDGGPPGSDGASLPPFPLAPAVGSGLETACNGVDDDGDGLVDWLQPTGPNACDTNLKGACARGFAACEGGRRICLGPAPMPEVVDGIDNDCNGRVDDVPMPDAIVHPRALVLAPRYAWTDAAPDIATVSAVLAQAGIPFDEQPAGTDWQAELQRLDGYSLAVVPGYLLGAAMGAGTRAAFEQFASRGGVVVVFKPVGSGEERQAWALTGLRSSVRRRDVLDIRFDGARPPAVSDLDSPEERTLRINEHAAPDAVESYLLDPDPAAGTEVVAHGFGGAMSGAAITRRPLGKGAIYAMGHDLATFGAARTYVNFIEPTAYVLRL